MMESDVVYGHYTSRKTKLLKGYENTGDAVETFLAEQYGIELTQTLVAEATREFET